MIDQISTASPFYQIYISTTNDVRECYGLCKKNTVDEAFVPICRNIFFFICRSYSFKKKMVYKFCTVEGFLLEDFSGHLYIFRYIFP